MWHKAKGVSRDARISMRRPPADNVQRSTVAKVRKVYNKQLQVGTQILLIDGAQAAKGDALIQDLDYFKSGVVVFWSVARPDEGRVPFEKMPSSRRNPLERELVPPSPNEEQGRSTTSLVSDLLPPLLVTKR